MLASALAWPMERIAGKLLASEGGIDFSQPCGEPAIVPPDGVSWQVFRNPVTMFIGGVAADQRGDFAESSLSCSTVSEVSLTLAAGPLILVAFFLAATGLMLGVRSS